MLLYKIGDVSSENFTGCLDVFFRIVGSVKDPDIPMHKSDIKDMLGSTIASRIFLSINAKEPSFSFHFSSLCLLGFIFPIERLKVVRDELSKDWMNSAAIHKEIFLVIRSFSGYFFLMNARNIILYRI